MPMTPAELAARLLADHGPEALNFALATVAEISRRNVQQAAGAVLCLAPTKRSSPAKVAVAVVARHYGLEEPAMFVVRSVRKTAKVRWMAWTVLRRKLGMTYDDIGQMFGRDHTSIMMGVRRLSAPTVWSEPDWLEICATIDRVLSGQSELPEAAE